MSGRDRSLFTSVPWISRDRPSRLVPTGHQSCELQETRADGKGDSSQPPTMAPKYRWIRATASSPPDQTLQLCWNKNLKQVRFEPMLPHQELTFWSLLLFFSSSERHGKWKYYQRAAPSKVNQNFVKTIQNCSTHGWWLLWLYTTSRLRIKLHTSNIGPWRVWRASLLANQTVDCNVSHHSRHCMLLNQVFKWPSVSKATLGCMCAG